MSKRWALVLGVVAVFLSALVVKAQDQVGAPKMLTPEIVKNAVGLVKEGSVQRGESLAVRFEVTDGRSTIPVAYQGLLPDLFREGQGVVAEGALDPAGTLRADSVLAKHDETYMPKEVADALKKQGHWKDEKKAGAAPRGGAQ